MTLAHIDLRYLTCKVLLSSKVSQATATIHLLPVKSVLELSAHFTFSMSNVCSKKKNTKDFMYWINVNGLVKRWIYFTKVFTWMLELHLSACRFALSKSDFHLRGGAQLLQVLFHFSYVLDRFLRVIPPNSYPKSLQELLQLQIAGPPGSDNLWIS